MTNIKTIIDGSKNIDRDALFNAFIGGTLLFIMLFAALNLFFRIFISTISYFQLQNFWPNEGGFLTEALPAIFFESWSPFAGPPLSNLLINFYGLSTFFMMLYVVYERFYAARLKRQNKRNPYFILAIMGGIWTASVLFFQNAYESDYVAPVGMAMSAALFIFSALAPAPKGSGDDYASASIAVGAFFLIIQASLIVPSHDSFNPVTSAERSLIHAEMIDSQREGRVMGGMSYSSSCMADNVMTIPSPNPYWFGLKSYPCDFGEVGNAGKLTHLEKLKYLAYRGNYFDVSNYLNHLSVKNIPLSNFDKLTLQIELFEALEARLADLNTLPRHPALQGISIEVTDFVLARNRAFYNEVKARANKGTLEKDADYLIQLIKTSSQGEFGPSPVLIKNLIDWD